jgi:hypothetical protein
MEVRSVKRQGEVVPMAVAVGTTSCPDINQHRVVTSVSCIDALSVLICADWLPQDGLFGLSGVRGLEASVAVAATPGVVAGMAAHRSFAGPLTGAAVTTGWG